MWLSHILIVILLMAIWGFSFIAIKEGLLDMPPLLLCFFRFFLTCIPAIFFVKKPILSWKIIVLYGIFMFTLKFSLIFFSINESMPVGLASLLVQLQVFFTILLAVIFSKEKLHKWQVMGAMTSFGGLAVVGLHIGGNVTLLGLIFIIAAAMLGSS